MVGLAPNREGNLAKLTPHCAVLPCDAPTVISDSHNECWPLQKDACFYHTSPDNCPSSFKPAPAQSQTPV